jgi:hypothetical protein
MLPIAHHVAVELFGHEYSPRTPFEHVCAFTAVGVILALAVYGAWVLGTKMMSRPRTRSRA